jgi:hypothetical protein
MRYVLKYNATRREVWRWYWRRWIDGAWMGQFFIAAAISAYSAFSSHLSSTRFILVLLAVFLVVVGVFAAWPQLAFKSQERVLEVDSNGWSTQIGKRSGSKNWGEVKSVRAEQGVVVITSRSGNALLVPSSAFPSADEQSRFVQDAQAWHRGHAV